jgi:hypothetical protein
MVSRNERRQVGQEIVLSIRSGGKSVKVIELDGVGLADGIMSKRNRRYCYGDDKEQKAERYAEKTAEKIREQREVPVTIVRLGERFHDKLQEVDRDAE